MTGWMRWRGLAVLALLGCAHDPARAQLVELNRTLQSQNAAYARQVAELENRVFILDSKVGGGETRPARSEAPPPRPELPRVTLDPKHPAALEPAEPPGEPDVEYVGEAARTDGKRPLLRLHGEQLLVIPGRGSEGTLAVTTEGSAAEGYRRALADLRAGRHTEAVAGFRAFLRDHPGHDFADNAQYWLGECFYDQKDYPSALREFRRVVDRFAEGNKVPDALLKIAFCHLALGSLQVGRQSLEQIVRTYPRHQAALLASARLSELEEP